MDLSRYRPKVGVGLANRLGEVWLGRRAKTPGPTNWQFPQGGLDRGEAPEAAALRELFEETGARSVEPLGRTEDWMVYDFPPEHPRRKGQNWLGQKQLWFAYRFVGEDAEFELERHQEVEFDAWRWASFEDALADVVPFKRRVYEKVSMAFRPLITPAI